MTEQAKLCLWSFFSLSILKLVTPGSCLCICSGLNSKEVMGGEGRWRKLRGCGKDSSGLAQKLCARVDHCCLDNGELSAI